MDNIDRTSHINLVENPDVKDFLNNCSYMKLPTGKELDEIGTYFCTIPEVNHELPQNIISIDGSNYEASVRKELPFTRVGFVKISSLLMQRDKLKDLSENRFVDPFEVAKLSNDNSSVSFALPSTNVVYNGEESVRDSFRKVLDEKLYQCRFKDSKESTSLRTTLFFLLNYLDKKHGGEERIILFKCPSCNAENIELWDVPEVQRCPHCGKPVYISDCLRIWEDIIDFGSNQSALTRFTNVAMHLLMVHYIRYLKENLKDTYLNVLSNMCFVINGPLAIFGNPAKLHSYIMEFLFDINQELIKSGRAPLIVIGIQKSGYVCDYFKMIGTSIRNNSMFALSDDFRYKYISFDKEPSSSTFGAETYYGQDFMMKTKSGKLYVFNALLPFKNKNDREKFKLDKSNISNYKNIGEYAKLIEEFECDLFNSTLVPIALAQKYTAISLEPGGKVLDLLAKKALSK